MKMTGRALVLFFVFASNAWAIGGSDSWARYYSDPQMTQIIGWTHKTCNDFVGRSGLYPGSTGWNTYTATHDVYEWDDDTACDTGGEAFDCWIWYGAQDYSQVSCP
jgi:hypothetical protein